MKRALALVTLVACAAVGLPANAQSPGAKPLRIVVGFAPGGTNDILARILAARMSESLGRPVVVDNRPGATGVLAAELVAKSAPDGNTLMVGSAGLTVVPALRANMPYDTAKDLAAVTLVGHSGMLLVAHPAVPAKSVKELIGLARAQPGRLTYATGGTASIQHLGGELFKLLTGIDMLHVPYKGNAPALNDLISGQVDTMFAASPPAIPLANAGRLRIIAVSTTTRLPALPSVPTIAESGVPGYEAVQWYGLLAPANTPKEVVTRLHRDMTAILQSSDIKERFAADGGDPGGNSPEEFARYIRSETEKWARVVKIAGLKPE